MTIVNEGQKRDVAEHIAAIEQQTDAEFVVVLARQSDSYDYIALMWAALCSLLVTPLAALFPDMLTLFQTAATQVGTFIILSLIFRLPAIRIRLTPKSVRFWRAANMARRQFLENNLHHTRAETGVLLFVSEAEHYVEIIADRGINQLVDQSQWQKLIDEFVTAVKAGDTHGGLITCIDGCGQILKEKIPATMEKNELPNALVLIE